MTDPMRESPTWRIPVGILTLFLVLMGYAIAVARYAPDLIGSWPGWAQTVVYLILGVIWLLPLRRFLIWMETGRWSAPSPLPDPEDERR
jgi:membrane protein YdbS with pleckstrin-like domain